MLTTEQAEERADYIMMKANGSLKKMNSSIRYRLMQTFIVEDSNDIILSLTEQIDRKPTRAIISYIPYQDNQKHRRLFVQDYNYDHISHKPSYYTMREYIRYKNFYLTVEDYSIDERLGKALLNIKTIDGNPWTEHIPLTTRTNSQ
jgi:hypothetical protein